MTESSLLERLAEKVGRLYSLPSVAVRVLELTGSPNVDTRALKLCIENDPALSTKILRVVNSSLFGLSRQVSDLNQALALLGIKPLKLLVLGFSLPNTLFDGVQGHVLSRYWWRTLTKAVSARELCENVWHQPGDEAFIAGLLQDIGMLVLIQELRDPYANFLERVFAEKGDLTALEVQTFGFDHIELGARLLEQWGLPKAIVSGVAVGCSPEKLRAAPVGERMLPHILHLADLLSILLTEQRTDVLPALLQSAKQYRNMSQEDLARVVQGLQEKVEQLASVLVLDLPHGINYTDVLREAHQQLSDVAAEAVGDVIAAESHDLSVEHERLLAETSALAMAVAKIARPISKESPSASLSKIDARAASNSAASSSAHAGERDRFYAAEPSPRSDADLGLLGHIAAAVAECRQARCPLSLGLIEIDRFSDLFATHTPARAEQLVRVVHEACRHIDHPHAICVQMREACFAVILSDCDRLAAVELGNHLVRQVRQLTALAGEADVINVSMGVATLALPPKNFPAKDLIDSAERCLHGAQSGGGNGLKSIGIY